MPRIILFLCLLCPSLVLAAHPPVPLFSSQVTQLKKKRCAFFHLWAAWSQPGVQEMPDLLAMLGKLNKVTPVIIDISKPFVQKNMGTKWAVILNAPFATYLKPGGDDLTYIRNIDKDFPNQIPYSVLYTNGRRKKVWSGALNVQQLRQQLEALCR